LSGIVNQFGIPVTKYHFKIIAMKLEFVLDGCSVDVLFAPEKSKPKKEKPKNFYRTKKQITPDTGE